MNYITPIVIEKGTGGERSYDIWSRLLKDRIIFLGTEINDDVSNSIIAQLLFLDSENTEKDIIMYINSPGGSVTSGLAIYDTMNYIRSKITTICIGQASSFGAIILTAGTKGKRFILKHSQVMIHQPLGGVQGQATDIEIQTKEILKKKKILNKILAKHTGQKIEKIEKDCERDFYFNAEESIDYGLVDKIITINT